MNLLNYYLIKLVLKRPFITNFKLIFRNNPLLK